jgi:hypothetical protein
MQYVEAAHGAPRAPKMLHVFSTNPDVLNRRSKQQLGAMDSMFAIGVMPEEQAAAIRKVTAQLELTKPLPQKVADGR